MSKAPPLSSEEQKELLLATGIHEQAGWNWGPDVPLAEFQGVTVDDGEGLVVGLDFSGQEDVEFELAMFSPFTSLRAVNFRGCRKARGECVCSCPATDRL